MTHLSGTHQSNKNQDFGQKFMQNCVDFDLNKSLQPEAPKLIRLFYSSSVALWLRRKMLTILINIRGLSIKFSFLN